MIELKGGKYYTLDDIAWAFAKSESELNAYRMKVSRVTRKLGLGVRFARRIVRYHEDDLRKIIDSIVKLSRN